MNSFTLKQAYELAAKKKKGLIVSGEIGGRQKDPRLEAFIEKHKDRQVGLSDETLGFLIVRMKPGKQEV